MKGSTPWRVPCVMNIKTRLLGEVSPEALLEKLGLVMSATAPKNTGGGKTAKKSTPPPKKGKKEDEDEEDVDDNDDVDVDDHRVAGGEGGNLAVQPSNFFLLEGGDEVHGFTPNDRARAG